MINEREVGVQKTPIESLLQAISNSSDSRSLSDVLRQLASFCYEDRSHSIELTRKGYLKLFAETLIRPVSSSCTNEIVVLALKVLSAACEYADFVSVTFICQKSDVTNISLFDPSANKLTIEGMCCIADTNCAEVAEATLLLLMRILRHLPLDDDVPEEVAACSDEDVEGRLYLKQRTVEQIIETLLSTIERRSPGATAATLSPVKCLACVFFCAFISEARTYLADDLPQDNRQEDTENRKARIWRQRLLQARSRFHCRISLHLDSIRRIFATMHDATSTLSQQIRVLLVKLFDFSDDESLKQTIMTLQCARSFSEVPSEMNIASILDRARLQAVLLLSQRHCVSQWLLEQHGGITQLTQLASSSSEEAQEVAVEVICLAASNDSTVSLLGPIVDSGFLQCLMSSSKDSISAAAGSALVKLSIKAKALKEDSPEIAELMYKSSSIVKKFASTAVISSKSSFASFSTFDNTAFTDPKSKGVSETDEAIDEQIAALERGLEILAALSGRTHVKNELVHGSYRTACLIPHLWEANFDLLVTSSAKKSTALFSILHVIGNITITNLELQKKALADKEMTTEEYDQLQKLTQIRTTDEHGNSVEEKIDKIDNDTEVDCRQRIKKLVSSGVVSFLVNILSVPREKLSHKVLELCCQSICQIAAEDSTRGVLIQQGAMAVACLLTTDETVVNITRRYAAHAIAKMCVTMNPNLLPPHLRLDIVRPLIFLCRERDSTGLQQFEALIAITNVISVGPEEQERFVSAKGIPSVHYLMFSDTMMIRRAATEAICNVCAHTETLKLLRNPEHLKLWIAFCLDWESDGEEVLLELEKNVGNLSFAPHYYTAQAAAGTLAMVCEDVIVTESMVSPTVDCIKGLKGLLSSRQHSLVIRALVIINKMCGNHGFDDVSLGDVVRQVQAGKKFKYSEMKQLEVVLVEWDRAKKIRLQVVRYFVENEIFDSFSAVLSSGDEALGSLVNEIIANVSYVLEYNKQDL